MSWTVETMSKYGNMTNYLLAHRLPKHWGQPPFSPVSAIPFQDPSDYRVLINDWPYGLTPDITHIVVWSRTQIPTDAETGDMTPETRATVDGFVQRYFLDRLEPNGGDRVLWFKNWVALQSVRSLEHIHVMIKDASPEMLEQLAGERRGSIVEV
jgi:hypothetical protein